MYETIAEPPRWLLVIGLLAATVIGVWVLGIVLKWALRLVLVAAVLGGVALAVWTLFKG